MKINDNTSRIISALGNLSIDQNRGKPYNWGILFNTYMDDKGRPNDEAWSVGESFVSRWSEFGELDYDRNAPFYAIDEEGFMRNQLQLSAEDLHKRLRSIEAHQAIQIPLANIMNMMANYQTREDKRKTRIIIKANHGEIERGSILLRAEVEDVTGHIIMTHPKIKETYYVDKYSKLQPEDITPKKIYQCFIQGGLVNVKHLYFKGIEILFHKSNAGFFPESIDDVIDSKNYSDKNMIRVPFVFEGDYDFEPVQFSCSLLHSALRLYENFTFVNLYVNKSCMLPSIIVGEKVDNTYPLIETVLATLDPSVRGDIG